MGSVRRVIPMMLAAGVLAACIGCEKPAPPQEPNEAGTPVRLREYADALSAANRFCHLWQEGDSRPAREMLDPRLVRKHPESLIRGVLSQSGNPVHQAYEIHDGQRIGSGQYVFNVKLFFLYRGQDTDRLESPDGQIVLEVTDDGRWLVRRFPLLP